VQLTFRKQIQSPPGTFFAPQCDQSMDEESASRNQNRLYDIRTWINSCGECREGLPRLVRRAAAMWVGNLQTAAVEIASSNRNSRDSHSVAFLIDNRHTHFEWFCFERLQREQRGGCDHRNRAGNAWVPAVRRKWSTSSLCSRKTRSVRASVEQDLSPLIYKRADDLCELDRLIKLILPDIGPHHIARCVLAALSARNTHHAVGPSLRKVKRGSISICFAILVKNMSHGQSAAM